MSDVIRLASNSHHYLVIYDKHTEEPLYLRSNQAPGFSRTAHRAICHTTAAARSRAVPFRATAVRSITPNWTGPKADKPTSPTKPWPAAAQPPASNPAAGEPENAKTAAPNGSHRHIWTQAKRRVNNYHHPERYLVPETEADEDDDDRFSAYSVLRFNIHAGIQWVTDLRRAP